MVQTQNATAKIIKPHVSVHQVLSRTQLPIKDAFEFHQPAPLRKSARKVTCASLTNATYLAMTSAHVLSASDASTMSAQRSAIPITIVFPGKSATTAEFVCPAVRQTQIVHTLRFVCRTTVSAEKVSLVRHSAAATSMSAVKSFVILRLSARTSLELTNASARRTLLATPMEILAVESLRNVLIMKIAPTICPALMENALIRAQLSRVESMPVVR